MGLITPRAVYKVKTISVVSLSPVNTIVFPMRFVCNFYTGPVLFWTLESGQWPSLENGAFLHIYVVAVGSHQ